MSTTIIENLKRMLGGPRDNALLRYSLGNECLKAGDHTQAVDYLKAAVERAPDFTAAWKLLGKALAGGGHPIEAKEAFARGIQTAERRGDLQAAKEMTVFLRRLAKTDGPP